MKDFNPDFIALLEKLNPQWDTKFKVSLLLNIILLMLLGGGFLYKDKICPPCNAEETIRIIHDTIRPKDKPVEVYEGKPVAVKVKIAKKKPAVIKPKPSDSNPFPFTDIIIHDTVYAPNQAPCDYLRTYVFDTTVADNFHLIINDEVRGEIEWRSIEFANLKPEIKTTVVKRKIDALKWYVGLNSTYNARNMDRWGIGPSTSLAVDKVGSFGYYYDARNNAHTLQAQALIRFRK